MRFKVLVAVLALALLLAAGLFYSAYEEVKSQLIAEINERQLAHAKQAARGIESFIQHYINQLSHIGTHQEIIELRPHGRMMMQQFLSQNAGEIRGITRLGADGRIMHTEPFDPTFIGVDVRHQKHVQDLLATHKPVVSDVFQAVQGYHAIAIYVPVFRDGKFYGGLAVLVPAEDLARQYLKDIRIGMNGYAWLISQKGIELYCPVPEHLGKSIYETSSAFPSVIAMAEKMMRGEEGQTVYWFDRVRGGQSDPIRKHAVYYPIHVGNTLWSVAVATPENEVLSLMLGFRNRLLAIVLLAGVIALAASFYLATLRAREQDALKIRRSEDALRQSEQKLRRILEHTTNVFFTHSVDHQLTYISPQAEKIFDFNPVSVDFDWRTVLTDNPVNQAGVLATQRAIDTGQAQPPYELEIMTPAGRIRWVEVNEAPILENGAVIALAGSLTDITDRKHLDEERRKAQKLESLGILAGGIAHDFNNLLMSILGNISLARHYLHGNERAMAQIEKAELASMRAKDLAQQLLTFSRGGEPITRSVDMEGLIRDTVSFSLRGSKSRYALSFGHALLPVRADSGQISQVINNIVMNADQAMPEGGLITVSADNVDPADAVAVGLDPAEYVKVVIADEGDGISPEVLEKIFDPYFTTKLQGSGLGLATAYSIVKNHGGLITVDTQPGQGTRFAVYLPATHEPPQMPEVQSEGVIAGSGRVLLVDDEDAVRKVLVEMLAELGYRPDACADGDAAVRLFATALKDNDPYVVVIMDLTIPGGKGGKETIGLLRDLDRGVRAIVSSGYADDPVMAHYQEYGFSGVIPKPFTVTALSEVLASVLAK